MFEGVLLGLGIGMLRGGRARGLLNAKIKSLWLLFCSLTIEIALSYTPIGTYILNMGSAARVMAILLQYLSFSVFILLNIRYYGMWLVGLGGLMNMIVIIINGGRMPVHPIVLEVAPDNMATIKLAAGDICNYMIADKTAKLAFMGDMIQVWNFTRTLISLGDLVIAVGLFLLVQNLVLGWQDGCNGAFKRSCRKNNL